MKQYCVKCYGNHDPDVPCYDMSEQLRRDMGIKLPKGTGTGRLSARTIILMLLAFVALVLLGSLFSAFVL